MSDKNQSSDLQDSPSPPPACANGCGFFGSPSTQNMCSKCFRETNTAATTTTTTSSSTILKPPPTQEATPPPTTPPLASSPPVKPPPVVVAAVAPARKVQKNTSRCFKCKKKVGLTGFRCHCLYVYCSEHRHSEAHDCDFDYQTSGRQQLQKANPVVVASKLNKI